MATIQIKRRASGSAANPVLADGEPLYDKATGRFYIGDGATALNSLPYFSAGGGTDTQPPSVPTMIAATNISASSIRWNWQAATDNVSVTGYDLQIATDAAFTSNLRTVNLGNVPFHDDGSLPPSTQHYARVRAHDAVPNNSSYSAAANATTDAAAVAVLPVATKIRFYPRGSQMGRILGCKIQGANVYSLVAADWTDLHTIGGTVTSGEFNERTFSNAAGFKFLRVYHPELFSNQGDVSEFEFYTQSAKILHDEVFGKTGYEEGNPAYDYPNAFDGNVATDYATAGSDVANFYGIVVRTAMTLNTPAAGVVGAAYNQPLTPGGGQSPYTTQIVKGVLPWGLSKSGNGVSGTPSIAEISRTIIEGDSIAEGSTVADGSRPHQLLQGLLNDRWTISNVAKQGQTIEQMNFQWFLQVKPLRSNLLNRDIVILEGGTNDIGFGATLAQLKARFEAYSAKVLAEGFLFIAQQILPRSDGAWDSGKEAIRNDYNAWLVTQTAKYSTLVTVPAALSNPSNTAKYGDGLHLTASGTVDLVAAWKAAIDTLSLQNVLGSSQTVKFTVRATDANSVYQDFVRQIVVSA